MHLHAQLSVSASEDTGSGAVDLTVHDPGRGLHHRNSYTAHRQATGDFQAQDAATQNDGGCARFQHREDAFTVGHVAQGAHTLPWTAVRGAQPRDGRKQCVSSGGQDELIEIQVRAIIQSQSAGV